MRVNRAFSFSSHRNVRPYESGHVLSLLRSLLTNRLQRVVIGDLVYRGCKSNLLCRKVPALGPALFFVFINDICNILTSSKCGLQIVIIILIDATVD